MKLKKITIITSAALATGLFSTAYANEDKSSHGSIYETLSSTYKNTNVGSSVNPFNLEPKPQSCYKLSNPKKNIHWYKPAKQNNLKGSLDSYFSLYSTSESYAESMNVSADLSVSYGLYEANASFSSQSSTAGSSSGMTAEWRYEDTINKTLDLTDPFKTTETGDKYIGNLNDAYKGEDNSIRPKTQEIEDYIQHCGVGFIKTIHYGNALSLTMNISASNKTAKQDTTAGMSAGAGSFAQLSANMEKTSKSNESSYNIHSSYSVATGDPSFEDAFKMEDLSNCQWDFDNNKFNESCTNAIGAFDETKTRLQNTSVSKRQVIKFPDIAWIDGQTGGPSISMDQLEIESWDAYLDLIQYIQNMRDNYKEMSRQFHERNETYQKLGSYLKDVNFDDDTKIGKAVDHFKEARKHLDSAKAILAAASNNGYFPTESYTNFEKYIDATDAYFPQPLKNLALRLRDNPSNRNLHGSDYHFGRGEVRVMGVKPGFHTIYFGIDKEAFKEVVVDGHSLYNKSYKYDEQDGDSFYAYKADDKFCVEKPAELTGYVQTKDDEFYPFVIHSVRGQLSYSDSALTLSFNDKKISGGDVCSVIVDNNVSQIPESAVNAYSKSISHVNDDNSLFEFSPGDGKQSDYFIWAVGGWRSWEIDKTQGHGFIILGEKKKNIWPNKEAMKGHKPLPCPHDACLSD